MQSADLFQVYKRLAEKLRQNPYWQVNISELRVQAATGRCDLYRFRMETEGKTWN